MKFPSVFQSLKNSLFAKLYTAQTISLFGDALTWLGLALLAYKLSPENSAEILAIALTLRVTAFVIFSPLAGVIADRVNRKSILVITHIFQMFIVALLPFVVEIWQLYVLIFSMNLFNAFFTPTYNATIPLVFDDKKMYGKAISLSASTYQLLGVLGPGIAGALAAFIGLRQIFYLDAATFLIAAVVIFTLPGKLQVSKNQEDGAVKKNTWKDIQTGTILLFKNKHLRFALFMQLVASLAGAMILVCTVGYVKGDLSLGEAAYGWVMAAMGVGATLAAFSLGIINENISRTLMTFIGALVVSLVIMPGNLLSLPLLMIAWFLAGAAQSLVNVSMQTLIAVGVPKEVQGRVYGAHFAWSHLWWAFAYPLAGWLENAFSSSYFLYAGIIGFAILVATFLIFYQKKVFSV